MKQPKSPRAAIGKLGVLLPGLGAVASTAIAGVNLVKKGLAPPIGSLTQLGTVRLGKRTEGREPAVRDLVPLAKLDDLEFGAWDIFDDDALESARRAEVLESKHIDAVADELRAIRPMKAAFYPEHVKRLMGPHVKRGKTKADVVEELRSDIRAFRRDKACARLVAVHCASTETYLSEAETHQSISAFERGLAANDPSISATQLYAWACIHEGVPFANGTPNLGVDFPAANLFARERGVPIAGKDFKTGQTLMKTVIAPGFKARMLGIRGWYSTNILGNRDGEVLDDPGSFKSKEVSKLGGLESILEPQKHPELYGELHHKVRIDYYPPRGDAKEGWDNIDVLGWLGYPMQMKVNFLCRDSILAAPVVLDLALFMDFAARCDFRGIQEWLGFYFKTPMAAAGLTPDHDLFVQLMKLKNTLRWAVGEDLVTHLGNEYYE